MPTSAYETADGYMNVGASGDAMWQRLCEAIGREDLLADDPLRGGRATARRTGRRSTRALNRGRSAARAPRLDRSG
jgi:crotonobetainyl-CoA:carnitine CoA-transferase CaiB-like acyl-CoA transferase